MKVKEIAKAAVAVKTVLKYRRDWDKEGPAVKALRKLMPKDSKSFRLYIPIGPEASEVLGGKKHNVKIVVPLAVRLALKRKGFRVTDYKAKRCVKIGDKEQKNEFNIGKVIADDPVAKMAFDNDPQLQNSENAKKGGGIMVVISCHPADIISMSTGRDWDHTSCMRLRDPLNNHREAGVNSHYLKNDVAEGTLVAYAVRADDPKIREPLCRVLLKPFIRATEEHDDDKYEVDDENPHVSRQNDGSRDVYYRREPTVYGNPVAGFTSIVERFIRTLNKNPIPGEYFLAKRLYDDGVVRRGNDVIIRGGSNDATATSAIVDDYEQALTLYENDGGRVYAKKVVDVLFTAFNSDIRPIKIAKVVDRVKNMSNGKDKATIERILTGVLNAGHDAVSAASKDLKKFRVNTVEGIIDAGLYHPSTSAGLLRTIFNTDAMKPYKEVAIARIAENEAAMEKDSPKRLTAALLRTALDKNWCNNLPESAWEDKETESSPYKMAMAATRNGFDFNIRNIPLQIKAEMWAWATIARGSEMYEKDREAQTIANRLLMRMKPEYPGNKEELAKAALGSYASVGEFVYALTTFLKNSSDGEFFDSHHDKFYKIMEDRRMYRDVVKIGNPLLNKYIDFAVSETVKRFFTGNGNGGFVDERNRHLLSVIGNYIKSVRYELDFIGEFNTKRMFEKAFMVCPEVLGHLVHNFDRRKSRDIVKMFANAITDNQIAIETPIKADTLYAKELFTAVGSLLKLGGIDVANVIEFEYTDDIKKLNDICKRNFEVGVFDAKPTTVELDPLSFGVDVLFTPEIGIRSLAYSSANAMNNAIGEFLKRLKTHSASIHERLYLLEEYCSYIYGESQVDRNQEDFDSDVENRVDELRANGDYEPDENGEDDQYIWDDARSEIEEEYRKLYKQGFASVETLDFVLENFVYDEDEDDAAEFFQGASEEEISDEFDDIIALREQIQEWRDEIYSGASEIKLFL